MSNEQKRPAVVGQLDQPVGHRVLVVGMDFGRTAATVQALMRVIEDGRIEVLDTLEIQPSTEALEKCFLVRPPSAEPLTYGPQRKGRGGKVRRW